MTQRCLQSALLMVTLGMLPIGCGNEPLQRSRSALRINELAPKNGVYQDLFGNTGPWIELYNLSDTDFDLGGYYISNSAKKRFKFQFPAVDAGDVYKVPANGVLLLFADDSPLESSALEPHLSFTLHHKKGNGVWLSNPDGYVVDSVECSWLPPNDAGTSWTSFARFPDGTGEFQWCTAGSPGQLNGDQCTGEVL